MSEPPPAGYGPARHPSRVFLPEHPDSLANAKIELKSIDLAAILSSLPAVLAGLGIIVVVVWLRSKQPLDSWYEDRATTSYKAQDYSTAYLCFKRLLQLHPDQAILRFQLAMVLDEQGKAKLRLAEGLTGDSRRAMAEEAMGFRSRAFALIRQLAPEDRMGDFPQAHVWLASVLMTEYASTPALLRSMETHLKYYLKRTPTRGDRDPNSIGAKAMLGHLYVLTRRYKSARLYLEEAAAERKGLLVELADVCRSLGETREAEQYAKQAVGFFGQLVATRPDNVEARVSFALATSILGDHTGAIKIVGDGLSRGDNPNLRHTAAQIYLAWSDSLGAPNAAKPEGGQDPGDLDRQRVEFLELGLRNESNNREIVTRLSRIMGSKTADAVVKNSARSALVTLAASGKGPPEVYDELGQDAYLRKQHDQARAYWEQAYKVAPWNYPDKLEPQHAVLANNLARVVSSSPPIDLSRALMLANKALELQPGLPSFRGTRGEILAKMGRDKEALEDLKAAAADAKTATPEILRVLGEVEAKHGSPGTTPPPPPKPPAESSAKPSS